MPPRKRTQNPKPDPEVGVAAQPKSKAQQVLKDRLRRTAVEKEGEPDNQTASAIR